MRVEHIIGRLRTLEATERTSSKAKGLSRTQHACHKAAADAYGLASGLLEDEFPEAAYAFFEELEK